MRTFARTKRGEVPDRTTKEDHGLQGTEGVEGMVGTVC